MVCMWFGVVVWVVACWWVEIWVVIVIVGLLVLLW